jgi:glutamate synthase (NADPH/NADH) small chain
VAHRVRSFALHQQFPEFTGRICPAPCEASCTLNIIDNPVTIKTIECQIVDRAWEEGLGPAGDGAQKDRQDGGGGGLRAPPAWRRPATGARRAQRHPVRKGRPHRRAAALRHSRLQDGKASDRPAHAPDGSRRRVFRTNVEVGVTVSMDMLQADYDAVVLSGGAEAPRDLPVPGRELDGIHFAMDFLTQQNKRVAGDPESKAAPDGTFSAKGKHVVVIGGGDTGSDCIGTSNRHGAASVTQFEIMPQPPAKENKALVWPDWPLKAAHLVLATGRLRARLVGADQARHWPGWQDHGAGMRAG